MAVKLVLRLHEVIFLWKKGD